MCAQCMASAATVAAGATGLRAWLAAARFRWMTPLRLKRVTVALFALAFAIVVVVVG